MGSDVTNDVHPTGFEGMSIPTHIVIIAGLGATLIDNLDLEAAAEAVGASSITLFTQTNLFARRMLDRMGLAELEHEIDSRASAGDEVMG